jgi:hypothetical protein
MIGHLHSELSNNRSFRPTLQQTSAGWRPKRWVASRFGVHGLLSLGVDCASIGAQCGSEHHGVALRAFAIFSRGRGICQTHCGRRCGGVLSSFYPSPWEHRFGGSRRHNRRRDVGMATRVHLRIDISSLFNAYRFWRGLSDRRNPDQPSAPPVR